MQDHIYVAIDLKSFYASVECHERKLDPLTTNLVVADSSRTEKTICLAVSPSLKAYGIPGRARLFEVIQSVKEINMRRSRNTKNGFIGSSYDDIALRQNPDLQLDYLIAPPRMSYYIKYSSQIYNIYLKYFSPDDIFVYSIDEVFCDVTPYLSTYKMSPRELTTKIILDVYKNTGITATAGIGTNLYLSKVAMDIVAKHAKPDKNGVRIAGLDELTYRKLLWNHKPLTDFWRIGKGYAKKLEEHRMYTMGDVARTSLVNEDMLYKLFGINAELLIDHSWGWEPCTMQNIKSYKPQSSSISSGQVLHCPYDYEKTKLIIKEMAELLSLDLVSKKLVTNQLVLNIGYDADSLKINNSYAGELSTDYYGRQIPKHAHGTINLSHQTSSTKIILENVVKLFEKIINKKLLIRRINITANNVINEQEIITNEQLDLFTNYEFLSQTHEKEQKEKELQKTIIKLKQKYGKNSVVKGMNFIPGATTLERNNQIGGHKS